MIESEEKVSIIVPVYKVEKYLDRCVESIVGQSYKNLEIILVDDGSPDNCGQLCDKWAEKDQRIRVIHKKNGGLSAARNEALRTVQSRYVSFVDSDDVIHPNMIELLITHLLSNNADMATTQWSYFSSWDAPFVSIDNINFLELSKNQFIDQLYPDIINQISITACGKIYKTDIFQTLHFPERVIYEDLQIFLKVLLCCQKIVVTSLPLYYYFYNKNSITMSNYLAHDRFGEFQVREGYIRFFEKRGLREQMQYAENDYLTFFMRNYFAVMLRYPQRKQALKPHTAVFRTHLKGILSNPHVCRMRKICAAGMLICPQAVYPLARRTIPDCLIEEMR